MNRRKFITGLAAASVAQAAIASAPPAVCSDDVIAGWVTWVGPEWRQTGGADATPQGAGLVAPGDLPAYEANLLFRRYTSDSQPVDQVKFFADAMAEAVRLFSDAGISMVLAIKCATIEWRFGLEDNHHKDKLLIDTPPRYAWVRFTTKTNDRPPASMSRNSKGFLTPILIGDET